MGLGRDYRDNNSWQIYLQMAWNKAIGKRVQSKETDIAVKWVYDNIVKEFSFVFRIYVVLGQAVYYKLDIS